MSITTIADNRIRLVPNKKLLDAIYAHKEEISEIPANLLEVLKASGYVLSSKIEILQTGDSKQHRIDLNLLRKMNGELNQTEIKDNTNNKNDINSEIPEKSENKENKEDDNSKKDVYLYLNDLYWLNSFFKGLREDHKVDLNLHQLLEKCSIVLPENEIIARNPELEARCQKLRQEQQNREYMKMTKNVDAVLKNYPEDTIAYQMKSLNKQIVAVFQFVLSVVAGFAFGFVGLEWSIGGLDFGLRLLLGIMFALIIALAEIYFLAKKLNEYDDVTATANNFHYHHQTAAKSKKPHED